MNKITQHIHIISISNYDCCKTDQLINAIQRNFINYYFMCKILTKNGTDLCLEKEVIFSAV